MIQDTDRALIEAKYQEARREVPNNVWQLPQFDRPVLTCGQGYPGTWLEHNLDNVFYAALDLDVALAGQELFFALQRADGLLPVYVHRNGTVGYGQIQSVIPLAFTAWQIAQRCGREDFLARAYESCSRYDDWLVTHRDRGGTGLVEMYCEFDTGHDHSRRVTDGGLPRGCPGDEASNMPDLPCMPIVSCDLSAMQYGGRVALAEMAEALGKAHQAQQWRDKAAQTKRRLHEVCFDPEDEFFYDVDAAGQFRKYRTEHITRLFANHVLDQDLFERVYQRYFKDEREFATPYPFPSIALSDPAHDTTYPLNSWGCQSQALTALRATLWMEHYGKAEDFEAFMRVWVGAIARSAQHFSQEMHPVTGIFSECAPYYTPTLLLYLDFVDRLSGREAVSLSFVDR